MTKSGVVVLLLVGGLAVPVYAKKKKDAPLPQLFCQAQFVYVQAFDGDINNPYLLPADRDAAEDVEQRLQDWHRYTLVMNRYEADLVFVVRADLAADRGLERGRRGRCREVGRCGFRWAGPGGRGRIRKRIRERRILVVRILVVRILGGRIQGRGRIRAGREWEGRAGCRGRARRAAKWDRRTTGWPSI
ncbi:MAG: hypothetical protein WB974_09430 [Acidobacteriaceae bacterium]